MLIKLSDSKGSIVALTKSPRIPPLVILPGRIQLLRYLPTIPPTLPNLQGNKPCILSSVLPPLLPPTFRPVFQEPLPFLHFLSRFLTAFYYSLPRYCHPRASGHFKISSQAR